MKILHHKYTIMLVLFLGLFTSEWLLAQDDYYDVYSASPDMAAQGTINMDIEIVGAGFDNSIDEVEFLARCSDPEESCSYSGWVQVNHFAVRGPKKIIANVDVPVNEEQPLPASYQGHDVKVTSSTRGRGGKGTTLFKVQSETVSPSECNYEFEAVFDDLDEDGVTSDGNPYDAIGGTGFRLDTNGSQKLETDNDTRFVFIDFSNAMPDSSDCMLGDPLNAAGAAGFCDKFKGVNLRIEHQIQDLDSSGLCTMDPGTSQRLAVRVVFESGSEGLLKNIFKNGKVSGKGPTALRLNYGCLDENLLQGDIDLPENWPLVSRMNDNTWRIEATRACLHTLHGQKLEDESGNTIYLNMPFGLTATIVNAN